MKGADVFIVRAGKQREVRKTRAGGGGEVAERYQVILVGAFLKKRVLLLRISYFQEERTTHSENLGKGT